MYLSKHLNSKRRRYLYSCVTFWRHNLRHLNSGVRLPCGIALPVEGILMLIKLLL